MVSAGNGQCTLILPFGLRSIPKIFTALADAAEWIAKRAGVKRLMHYLDNFSLVGTPGIDEGGRDVQTLLQLFDRLGLPVPWEKLEG